VKTCAPGGDCVFVATARLDAQAKAFPEVGRARRPGEPMVEEAARGRPGPERFCCVRVSLVCEIAPEQSDLPFSSERNGYSSPILT